MRPRLLPLTGLLVALPVALGALPGVLADPPACEDRKPQLRKERACVPPPSEQPAAPAAAPRVVVADIDSGINPYHERFLGDDVTPDVLASFGITEAQTIDLTRTGPVADAVATDFAGVERGKPYWFRGTNIIGISFDRSGTPVMGDAGDEHGTGTAAAVLDANPDAVVVMVEGTAVPEAESWAFSHPAVDVVTTSYGIPGSPPVGLHLVGSHAGVVQHGKVHVGASDNSPALSPFDGTSGPWWSIGVAGFHEGSGEGRETLSGNAPDVVSDFTQDLPYCVDCRTGTDDVSGTSFATPRVAGVASRVVLEARRAVGHVGGTTAAGQLVGGARPVSTWDVRRALEEAATYPPSSSYDAGTALLGDGASLPVLEAAPYVQTGWGLVEPGVVPAALQQLAGAAPLKSAEACDYNLAVFDARVAYWDNEPLTESTGGSEAYRRCG